LLKNTWPAPKIRAHSNSSAPALYSGFVARSHIPTSTLASLMPPPLKIDPKTKALHRGLYAKRLYEEHGTYGKVSQIMGINVHQIPEMIRMAEHHKLRWSGWLKDLEDTRLANTLIRCGFTSIEQVRSVLHRIQNEPDMGPVRYAALCAWLSKQ
jgi:hypothetical protein